MAEAWPETDQEQQLRGIFNELEKTLKKVEKIKDPTKIHGLLKTITTKLKSAKQLIKEFERDARADGMPASELADRRRALVASLNKYIESKKAFGQRDETRAELMGETMVAADDDHQGQSMVQLVQKGRREIDATDKTLARAERTANDIEAIGIATASTLAGQTKQLEKVVDGLNEIEFNMKKATKVIRDITRGLATDKCISFLMFLVAAGVVALIVVKIIKPNQKSLVAAATNTTAYNSTLANLTGLSTQVLTELVGKRRLMRAVAAGRFHLPRVLGVIFDNQDQDWQ